MISRSHPRHPAPRCFTLIELLLTVALVLVLLGAVIYNFSSAASGARLNEGAGQVEALFRFARAHAESTGKQVRILFPESEGGDSAEMVAAESPASTVRVTWEADPVGAPGVFRDLPAAASYVQSISNLVSIQMVQPDGQGAEGTGVSADALPNAGSTEEPAAEAARNPFSIVTFYPDGTGDSVEVVLASRDEEDVRRLMVRMTGLTGIIRRHVIAEANAAELEPSAPATEAAAEGLK
ncbi:MAG: hypothetical protein HZA92_00550 [Verrucomicrobia bacterium]|nr:hypothetical protein [Verrucomicrobiota bacterium]